MDGFLLLAFLFLIAGVIWVPLATRLGLGSVLGYLVAGISIGPLLDNFGVDVVSIQHFAEFGVVMMLFLIGLELEPRMLWQLKDRLLGLGGLQVSLSTLAIMAVAVALGQSWSVALVTGLILALSSTAIVLQSLSEKGLLKSEGGEAGFSVLLFQDIAVIPMLALIPLLALPELTNEVGHVAAGGHGDAGGHDRFSFIDDLAAWQQGLATIGAIAAIIIGGSTLTRPMFRFIAMAKLRELFIAAALLWVIGIALLMTLVGLSPALGTFLAGVVLANSEYRHELESNIDPFKGLLLGLFFITVGASINFALLLENPGLFAALTGGLILIKAVILLALAIIFRITDPDRWLFSLSLAQAGEFGFVLLSFAVGNHVLPPALAEQLLLVVALSMLVTPLLFIVYDRVIVPLFTKGDDRAADPIDQPAGIIIAGHGRFGGVVNRILRGSGFKTVVLDHHSERLERLRTFGFKVFFGDATRPDLLHAAGLADARMLVVAIDDPDQATDLVRYGRTHFPGLHIVARAQDRDHVYDLYAAGANDIVREQFDAAVRAGRSALEALGLHPYDAELRTQGYVRFDKRTIRELAALYDPDIPNHKNAAYVARAKALIAREEEAMAGRGIAYADRSDRGWRPPRPEDVETLKAESEENR